MPFPTTPVHHTFPSNGALPVPFVAPLFSGDDTPVVSGGVVICGSGLFGSALLEDGDYGDQEMYFDIPGASFSQAWVVLRISGPAGTRTCYYVQFDVSGGIDIVRLTAGASSGSLAHIATNAAAGWTIGAAAKTNGNDVTIEAWGNSGAGFSLLGSFTDTAILSTTPALRSGRLGFVQFGNGATTRSIDNVGGGPIPSALSSLRRTKPRTPALAVKA